MFFLSLATRADRRGLIDELRAAYHLSIERSYCLLTISKLAYYYKPIKRPEEAEIKTYLSTLAEHYKRWGFDKMMLHVKLDNKPWNHKRVYRLYCELGLNIRIKPRKLNRKAKQSYWFSH